jgi:hypothetical protein
MSRWFVCGPDLADRPNHTDNRPIIIYPVAARGIPPPDGAEVEHLAPWCVLYSTMHGGKPRDRPQHMSFNMLLLYPNWHHRPQSYGSETGGNTYILETVIC